MADILNVYMGTPPIARTVATAVFLCSVAFYTGMVSAEPFIFHYSLIFKYPPGLYRLVTSFLLTGSGMSVLFDTYFVFTYLSQLEGNPKFKNKADVIWYLIFVAGVICPLNAFFTEGMLLLHALLTALCYTATQDQRGMNAHFYIITIPAQLTPYCLLLVQLLFPGGWVSLKIGLTGLVAAHLHDFLTRIYPEFGNGINLIPTPGFLTWAVDALGVGETTPGPAEQPQREGARSGPLPDSWRSKGPGRRLG
ncbi:Der1-like family-domain-containing protein [Annulohypoxylon maeteangense]|uniref:Der1-like family-domain-containing protein n=1 Tax=Annulohypoxylon maeteangense TaxID=1927788 RepID=UPI002007B36E|nr:Der1-like family-domain-containing protein [Annulohypoxylon maeteangense]KAI0884340.1 Der1-like family-domain-containing protein [Annulohypoxylon maeteangense]